jgi:hypothetical protein
MQVGDFIPLGRGVSANFPDQPSGIDFHPPTATTAAQITIWDGVGGRCREGGTYSLTEALAARFAKDFARANAEWFRPWLERLAAGESVSIPEMVQARPASALGGPSSPYFLLGVRRERTNSGEVGVDLLILYRPRDRKVVMTGARQSAHDLVENDLQTWLSTRPHRVAATTRSEAQDEQPGAWFRRVCVEAGCGWFLPLARRIAAGEPVAPDEIVGTYAANYHGQAMPCGFFEDLVARQRPRVIPPNNSLS